MLLGQRALDQHRASQFRLQPLAGGHVHVQQPYPDMGQVGERRALRRKRMQRNHLGRDRFQSVQGAGLELQGGRIGALRLQVAAQPPPRAGRALAPVVHQRTLVLIEHPRAALVEQRFDRRQIDTHRLREFGPAQGAEKIQLGRQVDRRLQAVTFDQYIGQAVNTVAVPLRPAIQAKASGVRPGNLPLAPLLVDDLLGNAAQGGA